MADATANVMRVQARELTEGERLKMQEIKQAGSMLWMVIDSLEKYEDNRGLVLRRPSRELDVAKIRAEEAVMWAVKHLTG